MIRVLHVVTYMGLGGLETMLMNYYRHIDRTKIQFDFLVHRDFEAVYDKEIKNLGGKIFNLPKLVPWSNKYKSSLRKFFREHPEYKIIHVHQDCLSSVILKEGKSCGIPHRIAHAHGSSQNKDLKYPIKLFYKRKIAKYATNLLACSNKAGNWMFGTPNFEVMNNAINSKSFIYSPKVRENKRKELGISSDCLVLGIAANFSEPKNHSFLLDIFYRLNQLNPNSKLLLIGDGHLREKIEAKIANLNLTDSVILAGTRNDVNELLQSLDVFIMTSFYEGLTVASIEAQAAGLPCILSDTISKECEITNLITWKSLSDNVDLWCEAILRVANTPRQNTQSDIQSAGYDITTNAAWLENYYTNLTKE